MNALLFLHWDFQTWVVILLLILVPLWIALVWISTSDSKAHRHFHHGRRH